MLTAAGGAYRLELRLENAESVGPAWLSAAVSATYPDADLALVERYDGTHATIVVRWRRGSGAISPGDKVAVVAEGIELPMAWLPKAYVMDVVEVEPAALPADVVADSVMPTQPEYNAALKLTAAGAILLTVAYFAGRIRRKHVPTRSAELAPHPSQSAGLSR